MLTCGTLYHFLPQSAHSVLMSQFSFLRHAMRYLRFLSLSSDWVTMSSDREALTIWHLTRTVRRKYEQTTQYMCTEYCRESYLFKHNFLKFLKLKRKEVESQEDSGVRSGGDFQARLQAGFSDPSVHVSDHGNSNREPEPRTLILGCGLWDSVSSNKDIRHVCGFRTPGVQGRPSREQCKVYLLSSVLSVVDGGPWTGRR